MNKDERKQLEFELELHRISLLRSEQYGPDKNQPMSFYYRHMAEIASKMEVIEIKLGIREVWKG